MVRLSRFPVVLLIGVSMLWAATRCVGQTHTWTGAGGNNSWNNAANWDNGIPNGNTTDVLINAPSPTDLDLSVSLNSIDVGDDGILNVAATAQFDGTAATTIANDGTINVLDFYRMELSNRIDNRGAINLNGVGTSTELAVKGGGATLDGGGTITMSGTNTATAITDLGSGGLLTVNDQTIQGNGSIVTRLFNSSNGLIDGNQPGGRLILEPPSSERMVNEGTVRASSGGTLTLSNNNGNGGLRGSGTIEAHDGATVEYNGTFAGRFVVVDATLLSIGSGVHRTTGTGGYFRDVTVNDNFEVSPGTVLEIDDSFVNRGSVSITGTSTTGLLAVGSNVIIDGGGEIALNQEVANSVSVATAASLTIRDQTIHGQGFVSAPYASALVTTPESLIHANVNQKRLRIDGPGPSNTTWTNGGTLKASNGGIMETFDPTINSGTIEVTAGSTFQAPWLRNDVGGLLTGGGEVISSTVQIRGEVAPGDSVGELDIAAAVEFSSTATMEAELAGTSQFDVLDIQGTAQLDGVLNISLVDGFVPNNDDVYIVLSSSGPLSGEFSNVADGDELAFPGGSFTVDYFSSTIGQVLLSNFVAAPSLICDLNGDAACDLADLNLLLAEGPIANGVPVVVGQNDAFDLNSDGTIDLSDRDLWLSDAATENGFGSPYLLGDANLDGIVDVSDFNRWNANKFNSTLNWGNADFNGDGAVDVSDFNLWNSNRFLSSLDAAAVPEPASWGLLILGGLLMLRFRSRTN